MYSLAKLKLTHGYLLSSYQKKDDTYTTGVGSMVITPHEIRKIRKINTENPNYMENTDTTENKDNTENTENKKTWIIRKTKIFRIFRNFPYFGWGDDHGCLFGGLGLIPG